MMKNTVLKVVCIQVEACESCSCLRKSGRITRNPRATGSEIMAGFLREETSF